MPSRDDEIRLLKEWEAALASARRDVKTLPPLIENLRSRLGIAATPPLRTRIARERPANPDAVNLNRIFGLKINDLRTYRGKPSLPTFLEQLVIHQGRTHADRLVELVQTAEPFKDDPPPRNTILTRLNEMAHKDRLVKHDDGSYDLASPNGSAAGVETTGTDQPNTAPAMPAGQPHRQGEPPDAGASRTPASGSLYGDENSPSGSPALDPEGTT